MNSAKRFENSVQSNCEQQQPSQTESTHANIGKILCQLDRGVTRTTRRERFDSFYLQIGIIATER